MGKVIITHLVDGDPQGIRSVFISNKTTAQTWSKTPKD